MATAIDPAVTNKEFHNWIKAALALLFAKEGLTGFVQNETSDLHKDVLLSVFQQKGISPGTTCSSCTTANLLPCPTPSFCNKGRRCHEHDKSIRDKRPNQLCPNGICNAVKDAICIAHTFEDPCWKNTDAKRWCSDAYELAKCFLPPDGYSDKTSLAETDFNGMLSIIINNKRFQAKMAAQLNTEPNVCSKARDVCHMVRHSANYKLSDVDLAKCFDALKDLLRETKCLYYDKNAQDAVKKLDELQSNALQIHSGDITNIFDEESIGKGQRQAIQAICELQTESIANLEEVIYSRTRTTLDEIQQTAYQEQKEINQLGYRLLSKLDGHLDEELLNDLTEDLILYYKENESMIQASPLVEQYDVPLDDLYVQTEMTAIDKPYVFGQNNDPSSFISYKQLLFKDDQTPYRKIYVTAEAGMGKTSLSQNITMKWCHAKTFELEEEEMKAMQRFKIVFLLHLREYQGSDICLLDEMIFDMVSKTTSRSYQYSKEFIQKVMHKQDCLIILDGLDEWNHPKVCSKTPRVPHIKYPNSCTVLTTTRSWKLNTIGLPSNHIDRHVEMSGLDQRTSTFLKKKALQVMTAKGQSNTDTPKNNMSDFDNKVSAVKIGDILSIPYILLQLIYLWFNGFSIGKSKCEVFSNVTELTIKRGLVNRGLSPISFRPMENVAIPKCLEKNDLCKRHLSFLLQLSELAFASLFSKIKESRLLIDSEKVLAVLSDEDIDFCLKVGLLNKTKDMSLVSKIQYKFFFQHKSLHEFYAALHIASKWENQSLQQTILSICTSLTSILEMKDVFIFVSGINHQVYSSIFLDLQHVVSTDTVTCKFRTDNDYYNEQKTMLSYQSMQLSCLDESLKNDHTNCAVSLQDVFVSSETAVHILAIILSRYCNFNVIKSVSLLINNIVTEICSFILINMLSSLETLRITTLMSSSETVRTALPFILLRQSSSLKCLQLQNVSSRMNNTLTHIPKLAALRTLYFENVEMTHDEMKSFVSYLEKHTIMKQLKLANFSCWSHSCACTCFVFELSQLNKLETLYLHEMCVDELRLNTESLYDCLMSGIRMTDNAESSFCENLLAAPVLSSLTLSNIKLSQQIIKTIPKLIYLKDLMISDCDMKESKLCLSPEMTGLECIAIHSVTMTYSAWTELFRSISKLPRSVTLTIWRGKRLSLEEWTAIVNEIKETCIVELTEDISLQAEGATFQIKYLKN